jgi:heme exporter protein D
MSLGPHAGFILSAYAAAIAIVAALIVWIVLDRRAVMRSLDRLETHGITRRSDRRSEEKP